MVRGVAFAGLVVCAACLGASSDSAGRLQDAQYEPEQSVSIGSILVAKEKLGDPNFAESVVLIVQYDREGTLGILINRPSDVPLSQVFPHIKRAPADPVYMGGPVGITVGQALLRLPPNADDVTHVLDDVYVTASKKLIEKSVASGAQSSKFRLFLGYAGWAPGQLETEVRLGAWSILKGRSKIVFDGDPGSLWERLIRETHWQMARVILDSSPR
jgi:putative transcriptional regulator